MKIGVPFTPSQVRSGTTISRVNNIIFLAMLFSDFMQDLTKAREYSRRAI
jgi:hypothetical protein